MRQQDTVWYKALSLQERSNLAKLPDFKLEEPQLTRSQRRLARWQGQRPFMEKDLFQQRLNQDEINEETLGYLLGENQDTLAERAGPLPLWARELLEAFAQAPTNASSTTPGMEDKQQQQSTYAFLALVTPVVISYQRRLHTGLSELIQAYSSVPFALEHAEHLCINQLRPHLRDLLSRTMVLEMHVASLSNLLDGDTPSTRFTSFIERISQKDIAFQLLQEYPVVARMLMKTMEQWLAVSLEMLQRLCQDWPLLTATFHPEGDPGLIEAITMDSGDRHRDGHTVTILSFTSGWRLVYKPRSLAIEQHFQQLLTWLNARGQEPPFYVTRLLDRGEYGWNEFIQVSPCTSPEEVHRFYQRQGSYLALLHVLAATDYHNENIIAMGEYPVLIDLESLFQPYFRSIREDAAPVDTPAEHLLAHSVLRVGMLPHRSWGYDQFAGIDLSGLGSSAGQLSPRESQYWENGGTDRMRIGRKHLPLFAGEQNRPTLIGQNINIADYCESLLAGFTHMYELLINLRTILLASEGPLSWFRDDEVRVILRPTHIYSLLLREGNHPDLLRDGLDRDRFFDKLWVHVRNFPYLTSVIAMERRDLWQGDIPIFTTHPQARTIWTSRGEQVNDFLTETAMETVHNRVKMLGAEDLRWQTWLIRASFTTLSLNQSAGHVRSYSSFVPSTVPTPQRLLDAARAFGDQLATQALRKEQFASWIGIHAFQEDQWSIAPLGLDLYGGLPGVTLFLAYLSSVTGDKHYQILAEAALANIRHRITHAPKSVQHIGGFSGWGSLIYTFAHLSVLWQQESLLQEAEQLAYRLADTIEQDTFLDVMHGAAGCIGSLDVLYKLKPTPDLLAIMTRCGNHLLTKAQTFPEGWGWITPLASKPLTGFSHGAAGVAWALLKLADTSGEQRFFAAALAALSYEEANFSEEDANWLDLREDNAINMVAWCHGATGIGLGRLASLPYLDTPAMRTDIERALQATLTRGFGQNHSLCHGDAGSLDYLLLAARLLPRDDLRQRAQEKTAILLESLDRYGSLSGVPLGVETPGLMVGLAGIGYGLLRCAAPDQVPSVLILEAPFVGQKR
jgi:type 2 lantibiotic biosynthesis protein LanM